MAVRPRSNSLFASLGFSTVEALAAATSVAARACGVGSRKGRLAPGFDADILAVAGDLTTDVRALLDVRAVFRAGQRVSRVANPSVGLPGRDEPPDTPGTPGGPGSGSSNAFGFNDPRRRCTATDKRWYRQRTRLALSVW
jgi:hypothetical protein